MTYNIYTTYSLNQVQTILALILSILGAGWFFFLSSAIKFKTLWSLRKSNNGEVPVLETILPVSMMDIAKLLRISRVTPIILISTMVMFGLLLTSFEGTIVVNTVHNVESCKKVTVISQAQIMNNVHVAVIGASSEVEAMMSKRNKSEDQVVYLLDKYRLMIVGNTMLIMMLTLTRVEARVLSIVLE